MTELWHTFPMIYYPPACTMYILTGLILIMYIRVLLHRRIQRMIRTPGFGRWVACLATGMRTSNALLLGRNETVVLELPSPVDPLSIIRMTDDLNMTLLDWHWQVKPEYKEKTLLSDILCYINNTLAHLGMNPGLWREGPAVYPPSRGMTIGM